MIAIERLTQKIFPGKWVELEEIDKKFNEVESKFGFPAKKRYQYMIGGEDNNTLIIERQWDCLAVIESTYEKAFADPEYQALQQETFSIVQSNKVEILVPMP